MKKTSSSIMLSIFFRAISTLDSIYSMQKKIHSACSLVIFLTMNNGVGGFFLGLFLRMLIYRPLRAILILSLFTTHSTSFII